MGVSPAGSERRFRVLHGGENGAAAVEILRSVIRQMDAAGRAIQEPHPQIAFESGQCPNHGGQGCVESRRRRGQAALLHDPDEHVHGQELVHRVDYYSTL